MSLNLYSSIADKYNSNSQKIELLHLEMVRDNY